MSRTIYDRAREATAKTDLALAHMANGYPTPSNLRLSEGDLLKIRDGASEYAAQHPDEIKREIRNLERPGCLGWLLGRR